MARVVVYVADRKLRPPPVTFKYSAPAAIMLLGATLSLLRSVAEGQASVLVPIARMGFVVAALLGIFVLREPVTVRKMIGLVAALAGFGGAGQKLKRAGAFNLLLDHPIGTGKKNLWHDQAQRPRGLQVDDELKLVRMLNGKISSAWRREGLCRRSLRHPGRYRPHRSRRRTGRRLPQNI